MNARSILIVVGLVVLVAVGWIALKFRGIQQAAVKWEGPVPEITSESIGKDGDAFKIELTSRIDAPVAAVFEAFEHPERSQGMIDEIKQAKVLSGDDKKKTVEFHILSLDQLQVLTVDLTYLKDQDRIGIKTVEGTTDIDGYYQLSASPDGKRTLVTYIARQITKLPLPDGVLKSGIKEQFANLMSAIKKVLKQEGKTVARADAAQDIAA
jgi:hypothetical protein